MKAWYVDDDPPFLDVLPGKLSKEKSCNLKDTGQTYKFTFDAQGMSEVWFDTNEENLVQYNLFLNKPDAIKKALSILKERKVQNKRIEEHIRGL